MSKPLKIDVGFYDKFTPSLTTEQHGALLLLMMYCSRHAERRLPYDHQQLSSVAKVQGLERWKKHVWPAISGHFVICRDDRRCLSITMLDVWAEELAPRLDVGLSTWGRLRLSVFERDGFACRYCGEAALEQPHCDHVIPRAHGGPSTPENLVTSCGPCNISKGARLLEEWRQ